MITFPMSFIKTAKFSFFAIIGLFVLGAGISFAERQRVDIIKLDDIAEPKTDGAKYVEPPITEITRLKVLQSKLEAENLINSAYFTLKEFETNIKNNNEIGENKIEYSLSRARGILIFPEVYNAGFFIGGGTGTGVLFARSKTGKWSYPSFFNLTKTSFGMQLGASSSRVVMMIMTGRGLGAIIDDNFKIGASISGAIGDNGETLGVSTTRNLKRDVITFAKANGLFLGLSFDGTSITPNKRLNAAYYNSLDAIPQNVIVNGNHSNSQAVKIKDYLDTFHYILSIDDN